MAAPPPPPLIISYDNEYIRDVAKLKTLQLHQTPTCLPCVDGLLFPLCRLRVGAFARSRQYVGSSVRLV